MLDPVEEAAVAEQFGVAAGQVRRDHLISPAAGTHCGLVRGVEDDCVAGPGRRP